LESPVHRDHHHRIASQQTQPTSMIYEFPSNEADRQSKHRRHSHGSLHFPTSKRNKISWIADLLLTVGKHFVDVVIPNAKINKLHNPQRLRKYC